jgi:hypothetical protein
VCIAHINKFCDFNPFNSFHLFSHLVFAVAVVVVVVVVCNGSGCLCRWQIFIEVISFIAQKHFMSRQMALYTRCGKNIHCLRGDGGGLLC